MKTRSFIALLFIIPLVSLSASANECETLNTLYIDKYVSDFSISQSSFDIDGSSPLFKCNATDKNFIMARAIHDLDLLKPINEGDTNYYADLTLVFNLDPNNPNNTTLKYIDKLEHYPKAEARTYHDGEQAAIFFTKRFMNNGERIRPTYSIVHEARHTLKQKTYNGQQVPDEPGHVKCTQGKNKGLRVCDQRLAKEDELIWGSGNSHEFLFLIFMRSHPNASALMKKQAQEQLNYLATYMFNELEPGILEHYKVQLLQ